MGTIKGALTFKHDNDCLFSGCPGHTMEASHQTTSDSFYITVDGDLLYSGDDNTTRTLIEIIKEVNYR